MAIVTISRIKHRRGLAENLPQLSHAELGWATDQRRLYIGNGPLSEGAPVLGNTEILTEHSNLTGASSHTYEGNTSLTVQTGAELSSPTVRTLQERLDDYVSVKSFGAVGDGVTDDTAAINRALYELFVRDTNIGGRRSLYFPAGVYPISDALYIPTYARMFGDGLNKTIVRYTDSQAHATAVVSALELSVVTIGDNAGTGYTLNDIVSVTGGTSSVTATVRITGVSGGVVTSVAVEESGTYTAIPTLDENAPTGGTGASLTLDLKFGVKTVVISTGGTNYKTAPTVSFTGGGGTGATAIATLDAGAVDAVTVTGPGQDFTSLPLVAFSGGHNSFMLKTTDSKYNLEADLGTDAATGPQNVIVEHMSFESLDSASAIMNLFEMDGLASSIFYGVKFSGAYTNGDGLTVDRPAAVKLTNYSSYINDHVQFDSCIFENFESLIYTTDAVTYLTFDKCLFKGAYHGVWLSETGTNTPNNIRIFNSWFEDIDHEALNVVRGTAIVSSGNSYVDVGNDNAGDGAASAVSDVIFLAATNVADCIISGDKFYREDGDMGTYTTVNTNNNASVYVFEPQRKEIYGLTERQKPAIITLTDNVGATSTGITFSEASEKSATITYKIERGGETRTGTLELAIKSGAASITDSGTETASTGVTFSVASAAGTTTLNYATTSTGNNASFTYQVSIIR